MSPTPASGSRLRRAPKPYGSMMNRDFAPLLSAQLRTAPTGRPRVRRNFLPLAPTGCMVSGGRVVSALVQRTLVFLRHVAGIVEDRVRVSTTKVSRWR